MQPSLSPLCLYLCAAVLGTVWCVTSGSTFDVYCCPGVCSEGSNAACVCDENPYLQASFFLQLGHTHQSGGCDRPIDFDRRVHFSVMIPDSNAWTDVASFSSGGSNVSSEPLYVDSFEDPVLTNVWLCSQEYVRDGVQFGWFQDLGDAGPARATWMIDGIVVALHITSVDSDEVWKDDFTSDIINGSLWSDVTNGVIAQPPCSGFSEESGNLLFFNSSQIGPDQSRHAITVPLHISSSPTESDPQQEDEDSHSETSETSQQTNEDSEQSEASEASQQTDEGSDQSEASESSQQTNEDSEQSEASEASQQTDEGSDQSEASETSQQTNEDSEQSEASEASQQTDEGSDQSEASETSQQTNENPEQSEASETSQQTNEDSEQSEASEASQQTDEGSDQSEASETSQQTNEDSEQSEASEASQQTDEGSDQSEASETSQQTNEDSEQSEASEASQQTDEGSDQSDTSQASQETNEDSEQSEASEASQQTDEGSDQSEASETSQQTNEDSDQSEASESSQQTNEDSEQSEASEASQQTDEGSDQSEASESSQQTNEDSEQSEASEASQQTDEGSDQSEASETSQQTNEDSEQSEASEASQQTDEGSDQSDTSQASQETNEDSEQSEASEASQQTDEGSDQSEASETSQQTNEDSEQSEASEASQQTDEGSDQSEASETSQQTNEDSEQSEASEASQQTDEGLDQSEASETSQQTNEDSEQSEASEASQQTDEGSDQSDTSQASQETNEDSEQSEASEASQQTDEGSDQSEASETSQQTNEDSDQSEASESSQQTNEDSEQSEASEASQQTDEGSEQSEASETSQQTNEDSEQSEASEASQQTDEGSDQSDTSQASQETNEDSEQSEASEASQQTDEGSDQSEASETSQQTNEDSDQSEASESSQQTNGDSEQSEASEASQQTDEGSEQTDEDSDQSEVSDASQMTNENSDQSDTSQASQETNEDSEQSDTSQASQETNEDSEQSGDSGNSEQSQSDASQQDESEVSEASPTEGEDEESEVSEEPFPSEQPTENPCSDEIEENDADCVPGDSGGGIPEESDADCQQLVVEGFTLPEGNVGDIVTGSCLVEQLQGTWECISDAESGEAEWILIECQEITTETNEIANIEGTLSALQQLQEEGEIQPEATMEILDTILDATLDDSSETEPPNPNLVDSIFIVTSNLLDQCGTDTEVPEEFDEDTIALGSTLLKNLDSLALQAFGKGTGFHSVQTANIKLEVKTISATENVNGIEVNGSSIQLPAGLLHSALMHSTTMRVATYYFRNLSCLLPGYLEGVKDTILASPVISSLLLCYDTECDTSGADITGNPIRITLRHDELQDKFSMPTAEAYCTFWEFDRYNSSKYPYTGRWSREGCTKNVDESNSTVTVCECDHLAHVAILLSPGVEISPEQTISLQIIDYVAFSISLLALAFTVFTYVFKRSLWSIHSYIHINLCISLMIAQLIFVVGVLVNKSENQPGCSIVAVLLHYFFLVAFMWMLMEGVVLYVILVKVFITGRSEKKYAVAFTLLSYGVPALYMAFSVPFGFLLNNSESGCWLRHDTHFVWVFITPVLLVILVTTGFLIVVAYVIKRRSEKPNKTNISNVKQWLIASISLVVVMSITWIIGVLVFHTEVLPKTYIFAISAAFQGLAIFVIYVLLLKEVRDGYIVRLRKQVNTFGDKTSTTSSGTVGNAARYSTHNPETSTFSLYDSVKPLSTENEYSVPELALVAEGELGFWNPAYEMNGSSTKDADPELGESDHKEPIYEHLT